jgi:hypothetical protein
MLNYIFPIFCFGMVISGIVFLGLREAADRLRGGESDQGQKSEWSEPESKSAPVAQKP